MIEMIPRFTVGFTTLLFHPLRYLRLSVMRVDSNIPNEPEAMTQGSPQETDGDRPRQRPFMTWSIRDVTQPWSLAALLVDCDLRPHFN